MHAAQTNQDAPSLVHAPLPRMGLEVVEFSVSGSDLTACAYEEQISSADDLLMGI